MRFRQELLKYKSDKRMTTKQLADVLDFSVHTLNGYMSGSRNPSNKAKASIISKIRPAKVYPSTPLLPWGIK